MHGVLSNFFFLIDWRHMRRKNTIEISSIYWNVFPSVYEFFETDFKNAKADENLGQPFLSQ